jgi:hypothetical protein
VEPPSTRDDAGMGEIYFLNPLMSLGQHVSVVKFEQ